MPLQELAGKATLGAFELANGIDLWALAATVEVSEPTERKLEEILEQGGITLLTLDWPETGLPPLAVLLAAVRTQILPWVEARRPPEEVVDFRSGLDDVAADPAFDTYLGQLRDKLSPGLPRPRRLPGSEHAVVRREVRQPATRPAPVLAVPGAAESPTLTIDRPDIRAAIEQAVETARADSDGDTLVAVLGGEGSGKTWAVANWWLNNVSKPILMLSVGRAANNLSEHLNVLDMLSHLAADQEPGGGNEFNVGKWRRRISAMVAGRSIARSFSRAARRSERDQRKALGGDPEQPLARRA
ncbi:hypothetical protein ACRAWD_02600 [Caulobacter segnis]